VAIFLILVAGDEEPAGPGFDLGWVALLLAVVQGAALHWRRERPELVMAVVLASGVGSQLIVPEIVLPIAGFFAIGSLAAARPPRVSLIGLAGLLGLTAMSSCSPSWSSRRCSRSSPRSGGSGRSARYPRP
jgi:hypothetical protein